MRRLLWALSTLAMSAAFCAEPPTDTNVVSTAEDAFGITLGPESLGLYNPSSVRGFSPLLAGNVRIDGLYFDQQGFMFDRLVTDTRIRVGLSAANFPWPAPSGIVDYSLRPAQEASGLTSIAYAGPFDSCDVDVDGHARFPGAHVGVAAGISYHNDEFDPGLRGRSDSFAVHPQWTPNPDISVDAFWGRLNNTSTLQQPVIYMGDDQAPPPVPAHYIGMPWAETDNDSEHYGMLTKMQLPDGWAVRAGIFRSMNDTVRNNQELYLDTSSQGKGDHVLIAEPVQHYRSTSGEIQVLHSTEARRWRQLIILGVRGRFEHAQYGGAESLDFGAGFLSQPRLIAEPTYVFGPTTANRVHEYSLGTSYSLQWLDRIKLTAAVRRDNYSNQVRDPEEGQSSTFTNPWLYNSSVVYLPTKNLEIFGELTRGLEDSGVAPYSAINRGEVLNATRSSQEEVGVKYSVTSTLTLLAGDFDINKTYFGLTEQGTFDPLGEERHRGVELSVAGQVTSGLHVVAGVLRMSPEVLAVRSVLQPIGIRPVGQANWAAQAALDYKTPWTPDLSFDCVLTAMGSRVATVNNSVDIPGYRFVDVGARYHMSLGQHSASLRLQVLNVTNTLNWTVQGDGGLDSFSPRRAWAYIIVDL